MVMVNGLGGGTANGTFCNTSLSAIDVEPGKTYQLRFIGGRVLTFASLAIGDHDSFTIVEADGWARKITMPLSLTGISIALIVYIYIYIYTANV
jgi:hypothetical protein